MRQEHIIAPPKGKRMRQSEISNHVLLDNIHKHYKFLRVIGHGQFGVVRVAVAKTNLDGQEFAIKTIPKSKLTSDVKMMLRELDILQSADHPNIVKLYETYEDSIYLHMVMELCTGGNILEHIASKGSHSEKAVASVMYKICLAVNHLHQLYICHRDIKPDNCLYLNTDPDSELKLVDFGLSVKFGTDTIDKMYSLVGTPYYMAPEVMRGNYSKECDIWSLGVILYLMLSGRQPFASTSLQELYPKVMAAQYTFDGDDWDEISFEAKDLISRLLIVDPKLRLPINKILKHDWFKQRTVSPRRVPVRILEALKRKCALKQFQRESMKVILKYLSSKEIEELKNVFKALDREKTGFITASAVAEAMSNNGFVVAEREIHSIINQLSLGSGRISYSDFLVSTLDWKALIDNEAIWSAFCQFDRDHNGKINFSDIRFALEKAGCELTDSEVRMLTSSISMGDGAQIDFEDFKKLMVNLTESYSEVSSPLMIKKRTMNTEVSYSRFPSLDPFPNFQSVDALSQAVFLDPFYMGTEGVSAVNSKEEIPRIELFSQDDSIWDDT